MEFLSLPQTDLNVSALCLGTADFGAGTSEADSFAMLDAFVEQGGNFLDTAAIYADWTPAGKGSSERLLGKWRASRSPRNIVIASKGAHPELHSMGIGRMTPEEVEGDLNASLSNLGVEAIDLYYLHRDDASIPVYEVLAMLEGFRSAGKLRYYACSNWRPHRIREAQEAAQKMNVAGFVANQPLWSLAKPDLTGGDQTWAIMDDDSLALHREMGLPAIPYSSQANGYFQKIAEARPLHSSIEATYDSELVRPINRARFSRLEILSAQTGLSLTQLVLGWLRGHEFPVVPIIGPRSMAQLQDSLRAADVKLTAEQVSELVVSG
ncbi:protein tas [Abditibacteriota bacterium]|nr:protein tas [Abditibacteriota bacterium]